MLRILKISTILTAVLAMVCVVFVGFLALQTDDGIEKFLSEPGVVEDYIKNAQAGPSGPPGRSPLVEQASAFARRINPPEPIEPVRPTNQNAGSAQGGTNNQLPEIALPGFEDIPRPPASISAKFDLVATCVYPDNPDASHALLNMPAKGLKWFPQASQIGHLVLAEVKPGSIVIDDGTKTYEIQVPREKKISLIKGHPDNPYQEEEEKSDQEILSSTYTSPQYAGFRKGTYSGRVSPAAASKTSAASRVDGTPISEGGPVQWKEFDAKAFMERRRAKQAAARAAAARQRAAVKPSQQASNPEAMKEAIQFLSQMAQKPSEMGVSKDEVKGLSQEGGVLEQMKQDLAKMMAAQKKGQAKPEEKDEDKTEKKTEAKNVSSEDTKTNKKAEKEAEKADSKEEGKKEAEKSDKPDEEPEEEDKKQESEKDSDPNSK